MRPYSVLTAAAFVAVALSTTTALGQQPVPRPSGVCAYTYGCGPYVPLLTTPELSLQQFSPNPVGASNATTGLIAGATNSTLSQIQGETSSVYTVPVWYQGGAPLLSPGVHLWPETINREGHPMPEPMREVAREERPRPEIVREARPHEAHSREERSPHHAEEARGDWTFFPAPAHANARVFKNEDVTRQNDKNGVVKYDGKTEKM